jgi:AcrR family transcriptional regulator
VARKYELKQRAQRMAETRQRITDAAVELHGSVGPARTTIAAIAERAGVERLTVYRHFPDETAIFAACSSHWLAGHPFPDVEPLLAQEPSARLRAVLNAVYAWYAGGEPMLGNVVRDAELLPALDAILEGRRAALRQLADALAAGWEGDARLRRAALTAALDFRTWRLLVRDCGLSQDEAVELMSRSVAAAA